ncbi:MAG: hypothetical protein ACRCZH_01325 [Cetobacterium sp.]
MLKMITFSILLSTVFFRALGFEGEYKNNIDLYEKMIRGNMGKEYINNNLRVNIKIVESLNVIVNKAAVTNQIHLESKHLKRLVEIKGSGAENTSLKLKKEQTKKIIASCDNSKW